MALLNNFSLRFLLFTGDTPVGNSCFSWICFFNPAIVLEKFFEDISKGSKEGGCGEVLLCCRLAEVSSPGSVRRDLQRTRVWAWMP